MKAKNILLFSGVILGAAGLYAYMRRRNAGTQTPAPTTDATTPAGTTITDAKTETKMPDKIVSLPKTKLPAPPSDTQHQSTTPLETPIIVKTPIKQSVDTTPTNQAFRQSLQMDIKTQKNMLDI